MTDAVRLACKVLDLPLLRSARTRRRQRRFLSPSAHAACFGVFDNFEQARRFLPTSKEFDQDSLAKDYVEVRTKRVFAYDYPVMWWLERAFASGARTVLDIGGSVGVHYYAYQRYLALPPHAAWRVVEVPAMVAIGQQMATHNSASNVSFTSELSGELSGVDVWIAAGSIQYLEYAHPADLLRQCKLPPRHILLNKLPLYEGDDFVTTQNLGDGAFSPLHVWNRERFIQSVLNLGYRLRDAWDVPERSLMLPGHPERSFQSYCGLYFEAVAHFGEGRGQPSR